MTGEGLDAGSVTKIESVHLEAVPPVVEVGLGGVSGSSIAGKPGGDDQRGATAQQLDTGLVSDLDPAAGEQRHHAVHIGRFGPLGEVESGALGAELIVEMVDVVILELAHVAVLRLGGGSFDVDAARVRWGEHVRRVEHRFVAQLSDTGAAEDRLVVFELGRTALIAASLDPQPAFVGIRTEHIAGGIEQLGAFFDAQAVEKILRSGDGSKERGGLEQAGSRLVRVGTGRRGTFRRVTDGRGTDGRVTDRAHRPSLRGHRSGNDGGRFSIWAANASAMSSVSNIAAFQLAMYSRPSATE